MPLKPDIARKLALAIQCDQAALVKMFAREFGLSPAARAGIETNPADGGDNPFVGV